MSYEARSAFRMIHSVAMMFLMMSPPIKNQRKDQYNHSIMMLSDANSTLKTSQRIYCAC